MALAPGTRLGPYEIVSVLGAGGMGEVYRARDPRLQRDVAIKVLPPVWSADSDRLRRFQQEARAVAALSHPNICQIYDVGPDYLVLEYIEGRSLEGPVAPDIAVRLALQIADALETAHQRGILHRDLKPANILITAGGTAKLLDFGLAKPLAADTDITQTQTASIMGTPAYMSPEQAHGWPLDERSDVFSLGAVIYELLSARRAFEGRTVAEVVTAILRDDPRPLSAPPALAKVVMRCLAKKQADRFQTMADVKLALAGLAPKSVAVQPSIAVLPFADMSPGKDHEWFSDGLAEEIINSLTRLPGVKVIARTSAFAFKGKHDDVRRIAEALGVTTILEGSVRKAGNRVRVTAQLVTASDGSHLWSDRYDRDMTDVFAIQEEIARAIAQALELKFSTATLRPRGLTANVVAYEAFLKARHQILLQTPEALVRSRLFLEEAIALDSGFALAYVALGWCLLSHATENLLPAREAAILMHAAAQQALASDPSLTEAHGVLTLAAVLRYDWGTAERHFRALGGESIQPMTRYLCSLFYLAPVGRMSEAEEQLARALREDPLNLLFRTTVGMFQMGTGRDDEGAATLRRVLELDEHLWIAHLWMCTYSARHGRLAEALTFAERAYAVFPSNWGAIGLLAGLLKRTANLKRALELCEKFGSGEPYGAPMGLVCFHAVLSEFDEAASWLEKAIAQGDTRAPWILPRLFGEMFTANPRWPALAEAMNL